MVATEARATFRDFHQRLADHFTDPALSNVYRSTVARLDSGEPVVIRGWQLGDGAGSDYRDYCLEPDGRVTPVEPLFTENQSKIRTVTGYRRPEGSFVNRSTTKGRNHQ